MTRITEEPLHLRTSSSCLLETRFPCSPPGLWVKGVIEQG